jgi:HK97 family phage major capsid protein
MKLSELQASLKAKLDQAEALSNKADATEAELGQVDSLLGETGELQKQIASLQSQDNRKERIAAGRQALTTPAAPQTLGASIPSEALGGDGAKLHAVPKYYGDLVLSKVPGVNHEQAERLSYAMGCFALGIMGDNRRRQEAEKLGMRFDFNPEALAAGTNVPTAGGYAVPEQVGAMVMYLKKAYGVARRTADIEPMGTSDTLKAPAIDTGLRVYPIGENRTTGTTESQLGFKQVELICREFGILTRFSRKINSLTKLGDFLVQDMAYQFALNEDNCAFNGDGSSTYGTLFGLVAKINDGTHTASVHTATTGHTSFGALTLADFTNMTAKLPAFLGIQPAWFISKAGWAASMQPLAITTGYLNPVEAVTPAFLGYPVIFTEVLPTALTAQVSTIVAFFGDMRLTAKLGDREQMYVAQSDQRYFELGQIAIAGETSFAWNAYRLGSTTAAGPMIALKLPAS